MRKVARWHLNLKPVARSILFGSRVKFCQQTAKKPVLLNLDGSLLKEIKFDKFKFVADQIMLISGGRLTPQQRRSQDARSLR